MTELPLSGERVIEGAYRGSVEMYAIYLMHVASYRFARQFTHGKCVLDLGCGSGYGSAVIADGAREVIAVDVSREAVNYAATTHARPNLKYQIIQPGVSLPFAKERFDVVLSFQVIEHVVDDLAYIAEARRVLRSGGVLIVITPNRSIRLLPRQKPWNRWHLREYDASSLSKLFPSDQFNMDMRFMTASNRISSIEEKRYRRLKWATLPVTLPFVPEFIRIRGLNILHALKSRSDVSTMPSELDLDESEIMIGGCSRGAINIVAVARKTIASPL